MDEESIEYFREREQVERDAALNAASEEARRAHEQLAAGYAELVHNYTANPWNSATSGLGSEPFPGDIVRSGAGEGLPAKPPPETVRIGRA